MGSMDGDGGLEGSGIGLHCGTAEMSSGYCWLCPCARQGGGLQGAIVTVSEPHKPLPLGSICAYTMCRAVLSQACRAHL
jgi:hypothetical protein